MSATLTLNQKIHSQLMLFLQLTRLTRPIGIWVLWWPTSWALWIATHGQFSGIWALFFLGTIVMRSAGCIWNDYSDQDIDPLVARTSSRPLATKAIHPKLALTYLFVLFVIALAIASQLNNTALMLAFFAAALTMLYPLTKRFFPIPQIFLGFAFAMAVPIAFAAQNMLMHSACAWLTLAAFLWPLAYDSIYAMSDQADDLKVGIYSAPITLGTHTLKLVYGCHILFITCLLMCTQSLNPKPYFFLMVAGYLACILVQYKAIKKGAYQAVFQQFKWLGAFILSGFMFGIPFNP